MRSFIDTAEDMQWLKDVHLPWLDLQRYHSAEVVGNEDWPTEIRVYESDAPTLGDEPALVFTPDQYGKFHPHARVRYRQGRLIPRQNPVREPWFYFRTGPIERGQWRDGYARVKADGSVEYPWLTKREAQSFALKHGAEAIFFDSKEEALQAARTTENPLAVRSTATKTALVVAAGAAISLTAFYLLTRSSKQSLVTAGSRVALIGDSIAVGLGPELAKLASKSGIDFKYEAHGGTTVKQWIEHAAQCGQCGDWLTSFAPNVVLVELGTNDMGYTTPPASYYAQLRDKLQALGAKVVWIEPPTMPKSALTAVRHVIEGLGVTIVPQTQVPISSDGVHPTSIGYNVFAQKIWKFLTS